MADWTRVQTAWRDGMADENANSLNATEQAQLRIKVAQWADTAPADSSKTFPLGKVNDVRMGVKVRAGNGVITRVDFGPLL